MLDPYFALIGSYDVKQKPQCFCMFPRGFQKGLLCGCFFQFRQHGTIYGHGKEREVLRHCCKQQEHAAHTWTEKNRSEDVPLKLHLNVYETKQENVHQEH